MQSLLKHLVVIILIIIDSLFIIKSKILGSWLQTQANRWGVLSRGLKCKLIGWRGRFLEELYHISDSDYIYIYIYIFQVPARGKYRMTVGWWKCLKNNNSNNNLFSFQLPVYFFFYFVILALYLPLPNTTLKNAEALEIFLENSIFGQIGYLCPFPNYFHDHEVGGEANG